MATSNTSADVYLLLVRLVNTRNPTITRLLYVPSDLTFATFHRVLQAAFGWATCHLYKYTVSEPRARGETYDRLLRLNRDLLHLGDEDGHPDAEYALADVFANPQFSGGKAEVMYEYDFGAGWSHEIVLLGEAKGPEEEFAKRQLGEGVVEGQRVWCVGGEGHPCAEDCSGSTCWEELKRAFAVAGDDGVGASGCSAAEWRDWYKTRCANGEQEDLDPWKWDIRNVNQKLACLHC
ncbi:putative zinc finger mynd-type protein [Neofusicoccum parvum]|nr:putative zinc finger mynd-type protein [Neofusicoccum parvum]